MRILTGLFLLPAVGVMVACGEDDSSGPANTPPTAAFTAECEELACTLSDASTDADGLIEAWAWDFGDGGTSSEQHPTHAYAEPGGAFTVTLTVTDDQGDAGTATHEVTVSPGPGPSPVNTPPLADFAVACTSLTCVFTDQSTDPDPDGAITAHAWDFGQDGPTRTSTEPSPTHIYFYPGGHFTVTLTVTDNRGANAVATFEIDVVAVVTDRAGTYERETPHSTPDHHSRFVLHGDGRFEMHDGTGTGSTVYPGRWSHATSWGGWPIEPGVLILDFDAIEPLEFCGEGYGVFFDSAEATHLALALCRSAQQAGLEEGFYVSPPAPATPGPPPPQAGQLAVVRDGWIHLVSTDGSGLVQLGAGQEPAWSPDGSRIAFTCDGICIMDADGSNVVQRTTSGRNPDWSPDGEWIAFECRENYPAILCRVSAEHDGTAPVTIHQDFQYADDPAWSPDGARIAFMTDRALTDFWFDIWVVAPDGSQLTALTTHTPSAPNPYAFNQPAWSPDGQRIALVTCPWPFTVCSSSVVSVMNADGTGMEWLAAGTGWASPTWSPDGQVIAYASANVIEWVSADGTQRGRILEDAHSPAWRPGGGATIAPRAGAVRAPQPIGQASPAREPRRPNRTRSPYR